jgi:hypothetical protein
MHYFKNIFAIILTISQYIRVKMSRLNFMFAKHLPLDPQIKSQLNDQGYAIIPNYLAHIEALKLGTTVEEALTAYREDINHKEDKRIFGIENLIPEFDAFKHDKNLQNLSYHVNQKLISCRYVMANVLEAGKFGSSGQGWHRDAFGTQFKAMIYLTDVNEENGPFEIVPESHKVSNIITLVAKGILKFKQNRITDAEANEAITQTGMSVKIAAKAGTLIVFNSTTIHRGHPIKSGKRIAATNYYLPEQFVDEVKVVRSQAGIR